MRIRIRSFNIYLLAAFAAVALGCKSPEASKKAKEASSLRLHLEANPDGNSRTTTASIFREKPFLVTINREPFLTEIDLENATLVRVQGGFAIQVQFNRHGTLILENVTLANRGRHIAILSQFPESRWLAAPLLSRRIADGTLVFTPDATEEESQRIVRGLTNFVAEVKKRSKF